MTENSVASYLHHAVVVGVDGSTSSWAAINAAAWEAERRGLDLVLVHGYYERLPYQTYGWSPYVPLGGGRRSRVRRRMLAEAAAQGPRGAPGPGRAHRSCSPVGGAGALVQLSESASLIVVGSRGDGGFGGLSIGSIAAQTAAYATLSGHGHPAGQVDEHPDDAGGDRRPAAGPVLVGGRRIGARRGRPAVRASRRPACAGSRWSACTSGGTRPRSAIAPENVDPVRQRRLGRRGRAGRRRGDRGLVGPSIPTSPVEQRTIQAANTSYALIEESVAAGLVVVGCRGRGGFAGLVLGSVSRDLVGHAHAPVAVVHDHA